MIQTLKGIDSLVDLLNLRAENQRDSKAYSFLTEQGEENSMTYGELDARARALAVWLTDRQARGKRALLLYNAGLDYIAAFFGCLYAGVVAVPAYPPRLNGNFHRVQSIIEDCDASFALTDAVTHSRLQLKFPDAPLLTDLQWAVTDSWIYQDTSNWNVSPTDRHQLAFLQYTSGSTSSPKGVMLSHSNLLHNLQLIQQSTGLSSQDRSVIWLPPYHDMGLIGGILQPLYTGFPVVLMSPAHFVQHPLKWLQTISDTGATVSGGSNFAYELCVKKITKEEREKLDLSNWTIAFTGSEPIHAETLTRFAEAFHNSGFRYQSYYPCYGLAEATLFVSGALQGIGPEERIFERKALEGGLVEPALPSSQGSRSLISSGRAMTGDPDVVIADPVSGIRQAENKIGEVWVSGGSVAQGYWNRLEQTEKTFRAYLFDTGEGPFLRTGDLGFISSGELFITGRMKDLIIVRGRNYYPQDIEYVVTMSHLAVSSGNCAAFSIDVGEEERLVIVSELERAYRKNNPEEIFASVRKAISEHYELQVHTIVLIKPASIHKTSSGKIQRSACRQSFLDDALDIVAIYQENNQFRVASDEGNGQYEQSHIQADVVVPDIVELRQSMEEERTATIISYLNLETAKLLKVPGSCQPDLSLQALGFDSINIVELKARLDEIFAIDLPFDSLLEGPTLQELSITIERLIMLPPVPERPVDKQAETIPVTEFPLSVGQRALWFIQKLNPENRMYYITKTFRVQRNFNPDAFIRSIEALQNRHVLLRAGIKETEGEPSFYMDGNREASIHIIEAKDWSEVQRLERIKEDSTKEIDLQRGPLFRILIMSCGDEDYMLSFTFHHIISDFWSFAVFAKEFSDVYSRLSQGQAYSLPALKAEYSAFVSEQKSHLEQDGERMYAFWKERLVELEPVRLGNPTLTENGSPRGRKIYFQLPAETSRQIRELAKDFEVSVYSFLLSALFTVFHQSLGQNNLAVGSPASGRLHHRFMGTLGYFANPVVIRNQVVANESFRDLAQRVHREVTEGLKHQEYPFLTIVERMQARRDQRNPLFNMMFSMHSSVLAQDDGLVAAAIGVPGTRFELGTLSMELLDVVDAAPQFDFTMTVGKVGEGLLGSMEYDSSLLHEELAERMAEYFTRLLESATATPEERVGRLAMLSEAEVHQQTVEWNRTEQRLPDWSLQERFEEQAARTPERTALVWGTTELTYGELNRQANRLAHRLLFLGVGPDKLVGICLERSPELVISMLAVIKAGGAYVPVDPALPLERRRDMMKRAGLKVLVTREAFTEGADSNTEMTVVCVDADQAGLETEREENPQTQAGGDHLMYVIYTSGSTGLPKGASVYRRGFANLMQWYIGEFGMTEADRVLLITSPSFDLTQKNIFAPLVTGGQLVLLPTGPYDPREVAKLIEQHGITLLNGTPSAFYPLVDETEPHGYGQLGTLRHVFLGGEPIAPDRLSPWTTAEACRAEVVNTYGPTECTDVTVYHRMPDMRSLEGNPVPIGRPTPNTRLYILNEELGLVPVGAPGELCIAGTQVGGGYVGDAERTAEKFVANPYGEAGSEVLYRTGDLAKYMPDGTIVYLGRMDHQVKIRGYRIELGEIEAALRDCAQVKDAVVLAREDHPGDKRLVAYVVPEAEAQSEEQQQEQRPKEQQPEEQRPGEQQFMWREELSRKLPEYMVPWTFVVLEELPLSSNGKVDRKALPAPDAATGGQERPYVAPRNDAETSLAQIWAEVLQVERVGIHDNFFERGGHSLLAIQVASRVRSQLGQELPVHCFFEAPTIDKLAVVLESIPSAQASRPKMTRLSRDKHRLN